MQATTLIEMMVTRWSDPAARPLFKGSLIDDEGCCCAQGDVLRVCGWDDERLRSVEQYTADREVAAALGISVTHAVLLRQVNDRADGCPQDVLAHPERILGDQASRVLAFWKYLDGMTAGQWEAARDAAWDAATAAARGGDAAWAAAGDAAGAAARAAARDAAWDAAKAAAKAAIWATLEIQGASCLKSFFFLPLFGIADPSELASEMP